jgi:hypothetical protein
MHAGHKQDLTEAKCALPALPSCRHAARHSSNATLSSRQATAIAMQADCDSPGGKGHATCIHCALANHATASTLPGQSTKALRLCSLTAAEGAHNDAHTLRQYGRIFNKRRKASGVGAAMYWEMWRRTDMFGAGLNKGRPYAISNTVHPKLHKSTAGANNVRGTGLIAFQISGGRYNSVTYDPFERVVSRFGFGHRSMEPKSMMKAWWSRAPREGWQV